MLSLVHTFHFIQEIINLFQMCVRMHSSNCLKTIMLRNPWALTFNNKIVIYVFE